MLLTSPSAGACRYLAGYLRVLDGIHSRGHSQVTGRDKPPEFQGAAVAAESGNSRSVIRPEESARELAAELLGRRRSDLGYGGRRRKAFARDRGINDRLLTDIENPQQGRNYLISSVQDIARVYEVTYESLVAVLRGKADELAPAAPPRPAPPSGAGWLPPLPGAAIAAARPYADLISDRLLELALDGVAAPSGAQVFGPGSRDAGTWDAISERWPLRACVWLMADLQARESGAAREAEGNAGLTLA